MDKVDTNTLGKISIMPDQLFTEFEVSIDNVLKYFEYKHLPEHLQMRSAPFGQLARLIVDTTPRNPERTVALRKLLEAKDAAVRAHV